LPLPREGSSLCLTIDIHFNWKGCKRVTAILER
jgi:hypothetical protein